MTLHQDIFLTFTQEGFQRLQTTRTPACGFGRSLANLMSRTRTTAGKIEAPTTRASRARGATSTSRNGPDLAASAALEPNLSMASSSTATKTKPVSVGARGGTAQRARRQATQIATSTTRRTAKPVTTEQTKSISGTSGAVQIDELVDALTNDLQIEDAQPVPARAAQARPDRAATRTAQNGNAAPPTAAARARTRSNPPTTSSTSRSLNARRDLPLGSRPPGVPPSESERKSIPVSSLNIIPSGTCLVIPKKALEPQEIRQLRGTINQCVSSFKSAQAAGYLYKPTIGPIAGNKQGIRIKLSQNTSSSKPRATTSSTSEAAGPSLESKEVQDVGEAGTDWSDEKMRKVVTRCADTLKALAGHLLACKPARDQSERGTDQTQKQADLATQWTSEVQASVQLRLQIAKACSDFGLVSDP